MARTMRLTINLWQTKMRRKTVMVTDHPSADGVPIAGCGCGGDGGCADRGRSPARRWCCGRRARRLKLRFAAWRERGRVRKAGDPLRRGKNFSAISERRLREDSRKLVRQSGSRTGEAGIGREGGKGAKKAGERIRTVNIQLGRLTLCQLSYARTRRNDDRGRSKVASCSLRKCRQCRAGVNRAAPATRNGRRPVD